MRQLWKDMNYYWLDPFAEWIKPKIRRTWKGALLATDMDQITWWGIGKLSLTIIVVACCWASFFGIFLTDFYINLIWRKGSWIGRR